MSIERAEGVGFKLTPAGECAEWATLIRRRDHPTERAGALGARRLWILLRYGPVDLLTDTVWLTAKPANR